MKSQPNAGREKRNIAQEADKKARSGLVALHANSTALQALLTSGVLPLGQRFAAASDFKIRVTQISDDYAIMTASNSY